MVSSLRAFRSDGIGSCDLPFPREPFVLVARAAFVFHGRDSTRAGSEERGRQEPMAKCSHQLCRYSVTGIRAASVKATEKSRSDFSSAASRNLDPAPHCHLRRSDSLPERFSEPQRPCGLSITVSLGLGDLSPKNS